jgi:hypothetical protein
MIKYLLILFFSTLIVSCNNNNYKPDSATDAVRIFTKLCNEGNFDEAKFLLVNNEDQNKLLEDKQKAFYKLSNEQRNERRNASIIVFSVKAESSNKSIVVVNAVEKQNLKDTFECIQIDNIWKVSTKN